MNKGILKNLSWLVTANFLTKPLWFLFLIFSANELGVADFGIYTFSFSFLLMFSILQELGLESLVIKDVAANKNNLNLYFNNVITYKFLSSIFIILIFTVIIIYSSYSEKINIALIIMLFFILSFPVLTLFRAFFRAYEKFKYESISIIIEKFSAMLFAFIGLMVNGLFGFLIGLVIGNLLSLSYCVYFLFKQIPVLVFKPTFISIPKLLKDALPFAAAEIFITIYFRLSSVMIMFITDSEVYVGLFNSSYRLIEMYIALPTLLVAPLYPFISRSFVDNKTECMAIANKIIQILLIISLPIVIVVFIDPIRINNFLFTSQYSEAYLGLKTVIFTIIPLSLNVVFGTILAAIGKQKNAAIAIGIATVINLITNYFLIQKFNYIGACYTIVLTESLVTILYYINIRKYFGHFTLKQFNLKLGCVLIIFSSTYYLSMYYSISILITLLIFISFYFVLLFVFKIFKVSQIKNYYKLITEK